VRPLPRLFAFTDRSIRTGERIGATAAAIASAGPAVALVARDHEATGAELTDFAVSLLAHARPADAALVVAGRPDIAAAIKAHGVHLRGVDLTPADARRVLRSGWIGRSVHSVYEAGRAVDEGADYLIAGPVYETPSHRGRTPLGLDLIEQVAQLGRPVIAIGGMTPERVSGVREAGAWGVAAITALWRAPKPARAALAMLEPWTAT
jgi:thiamine-phosphate pyrophosphorylase